jgi:hypothetical protein
MMPSAAWVHPVLSSCHTALGQLRDAMLSGHLAL